MWMYWLMLFVPIIGLLSPKSLPRRQAKVIWSLVALFLIAAIGLRDEVGGDWYPYLDHFFRVQDLPLHIILLEKGDPGYYGLSWIISYVGGSIYVLNAICAAILVIGTIRFSRHQPWPWCALLAATPYLLIVVGMGYTRQSAAIGFALLALVALGKGNTRSFLAWVLLGATFHKSAVLLLPIAALAATKNRVWTWFWVGVVSVLGAWLLVFDTSADLWNNYVVSDYAAASEGAPIRVAMNVVPAVLLFVFQRKLSLTEHESKLWLWMAVWSVACVPLLAVSATAVDRIALYFIPLQLFVFSRIIGVSRSALSQANIALITVGYFIAVQATWLFFASHAHAWLPYDMAGV